jgi:amino acid transporter
VIDTVACATGMALLIGYPLSDAAFGQPFSNYYFWATTGTLVIIVVYVMLCIGGIVFFARTRDTRRWNPLVHVLIPVIGAVVFAAALYGSVPPARDPQVDPAAGRDLAGGRRRRGTLAARQPFRRGGQDRLDPGRGGRHRRRDPGLTTAIVDRCPGDGTDLDPR